jgi:long-chain acyl-CoA synthetase
MHPRLHAIATPNKPALIDAETGETITFGQLEARANRAAHALRGLDLHAGDAVVLCCDNRPEFVDIYWAAQRSGLVLVPISTRLKASEIAHIVNDSRSKAILVSEALSEVALDLVARRSEMPRLDTVVGIGAIGELSDWATLCDREPETPIADESIGSRMAYSSGTTGRPKGIRYPALSGSPVQELQGTTFLSSSYGLNDTTVYLCPAPLYHASPLGFTVAVQALGGTSVVMRKFDAAAVLAAVCRWRVTAVQMVPTMFIRMLKLPTDVRTRYDLSSLKVVVHAAAPCPVPVKRAIIDWLGPIVEEFYAGSEGNGHVTITSTEWMRKPGSVGRAVVGKIHICDDDGRELATGETGTIYFSGGRSFEYHNDPDKTAASRNPLHPGWSTMGDVGHIDQDGYLFLSDRKDFMIIAGGVNIYPQEVENLLITHPAVADVAVIGVPDADFGEAVKAVVQPIAWSQATEGLARELIAFCRSNLSDVKCPRSVDFDRALPRSDTGKLFKKEVRARYWPAA